MISLMTDSWTIIVMCKIMSTSKRTKAIFSKVWFSKALGHSIRWFKLKYIYTVPSGSWLRLGTQLHLMLNKVAFHAAQHVVESQHWCKAGHRAPAQGGFRPLSQAEVSSSFSWCGWEGLFAGWLLDFQQFCNQVGRWPESVC